MKKLVLFLLLLALPALAEEQRIDKVPASAEEFLALRSQLASTPEGGATCFIAAMLAYGNNPQLGRQCLVLILDPSNVGPGDVYQGHAPSASIRYHLDRLDGYKVWPYLGYAYLKGASPQNDYRVSAPFTVVTRRQRNSGEDSSGKVKIFLDVAGFRPRPITLQRNDKGIWKALECSSMFLNVSPPASSAPKDDL